MGDQLQPDRPWEFVTRVPRHQECKIPTYPKFKGEFLLNDVIRCKECKSTYRLESIDYGSQRDPIPDGRLKWVKLQPPTYR